ncbi:unnamed protein product, partial [Rotaria sp. Silwood2]
SATGRCTCPLSIMNLVISSDPAKYTCHCPGHPFVNYTGEKCIPSNSTKTFSSKPRRCEECIFLATGVCNLTEDACICIPGFEGKFCYDRAETTKPTTQSSSTTNWTITVVIISAIAGLMNSIIKVDILSYS